MSDDSFAPSTDELLSRNRSYASRFHDDELPVQPGRKLAVVACMDSTYR